MTRPQKENARGLPEKGRSKPGSVAVRPSRARRGEPEGGDSRRRVCHKVAATKTSLNKTRNGKKRKRKKKGGGPKGGWRIGALVRKGEGWTRHKKRAPPNKQARDRLTEWRGIYACWWAKGRRAAIHGDLIWPERVDDFQGGGPFRFVRRKRTMLDGVRLPGKCPRS